MTLYNEEHFFTPNDLKRFSLHIRAYWGQKGILDETWKSPVIKKAAG